MRKLVCLASAVIMSFAACAISLADARAQIGACISDPAKMTAVMKQVEASDQVAFLADVNEAISKMRGSNEAKIAAYLDANKAALMGAAKGNVATLLAEVYATVAPEALPVLAEGIATDLLGRTADPTKTYTDEQFVKIAETVMSSVNERLTSVENGAARATFAIVTLVRASGGSPADLVDKLIATLPEASRDVARNDWLASALAKGVDKSYEPLLIAADAQNIAPNLVVIYRMSATQLHTTLLARLVEGTNLIGTEPGLDFATAAAILPDMDLMAPYPISPLRPDSGYVPPREPGGYQGQY